MSARETQIPLQARLPTVLLGVSGPTFWAFSTIFLECIVCFIKISS